MRNTLRLLIVGFGIFVLNAGVSLAAKEPFIFPKEGQNAGQLAQDKNTCEDWAENESGVKADAVLTKLEMVEQEQAESRQMNKGGSFLGSLVKGATAGAATGAIGSNIGNPVGRTAAQGTVLGGLYGYEKIKGEEKTVAKEELASTKEGLQEQYDSYMRAFSVCMEAKGYNVK